MATGRTLNRWSKVYAGGYDFSGYARSIGELPFAFQFADVSTLSDGISNVMVNTTEGRELNINCILDTALVPIAAAGGTYWDLMVALGIRADPAAGDPVYMGKFALTQNMAGEDGGAIVAALKFQGLDASDPQTYRQPWGTLVHAKAAEVGANVAIGYTDGQVGATSYGGFMMYEIFSLDAGTVTISMDDSATNLNNAAFAACAGMTTAAIAQAATPCAGIIELGHTATIRQYVRFQVALAGGGSTCTFALAFVRGTVGLN